MAEAESQPELSLLPLVILGSHISLAVVLTTLIGRTIFHSYRALPPSQATRGHGHATRSHVKVFSTLAVISLLFACYCGYASRSLSYRVWTAEKGIELPESIFGEKGIFPTSSGEHPGRLHLIWWLNDTPIYQESLEIVAEKVRYFWWSQQIGLAIIPWGMLLDIEGRRRNIPCLWAFMMLAQVVNLSFAQNLFYATMLLTPVPPPRNVRMTISTISLTPSKFSNLKRKLIPTKANNWYSHPILYLIPLMSSFTAVFLLPFASNTPSFVTVALAFRSLCFTPLLVPYLVPQKWGTVHIHPHDSRSAYLSLFRVISVISFLLHSKSTFLALLFNTPHSHNHRHFILHPFTEEYQTIMERSSTAVGKLLGAIGDHPVISAVGADVLLSGLSLGLWATFRGLDVQTILASNGLYSGVKPDTAVNGTPDSIVVTPRNVVDKVNSGPKTTKRRGPGRPKKNEQSANHEEPVPPTPRRRGRPRRIIESDIDSEYEPLEIVQEDGDEPDDEDWEVGALVWGLISATGLATASAGVFGVETTAR